MSLAINLEQILGQVWLPRRAALTLVLLFARSGGGLYWLVPAFVLLLGVGVMNAWVLLIEILR